MSLSPVEIVLMLALMAALLALCLVLYLQGSARMEPAGKAPSTAQAVADEISEAMRDMRSEWRRAMEHLDAAMALDTPGERLLLLVLVHMAQADGRVLMTTRDLAEACALHRTTTAVHLRSFEQRGLIHDTGERWGARREHRVWRVTGIGPELRA